jgi:hypothetical protein
LPVTCLLAALSGGAVAVGCVVGVGAVVVAFDGAVFTTVVVVVGSGVDLVTADVVGVGSVVVVPTDALADGVAVVSVDGVIGCVVVVVVTLSLLSQATTSDSVSNDEMISVRIVDILDQTAC